MDIKQFSAEGTIAGFTVAKDMVDVKYCILDSLAKRKIIKNTLYACALLSAHTHMHSAKGKKGTISRMSDQANSHSFIVYGCICSFVRSYILDQWYLRALDVYKTIDPKFPFVIYLVSLVNFLFI